MTDHSRRDVLKTVAGVVALGAGGIHSLAGAASPGPLRERGFYRYRIGQIDCTALYDGIWRKDHAEGFIRNASVEQTKSALAAGNLTDAHVTIEFTQTMLEIGGRTVLIDPGTGGQWVASAGSMLESMEAAGKSPSQIDTILISHFHPDHIYGLMDAMTDAPLFPEAEIVVPGAEYRFWTDPQVFTRLPSDWHGLARRIQATFPRWPNVRQVEDDVEVLPGVRTLSTPGHTPGHMAYHVSSGDAELIVAGDVAITPALFVANPGWHTIFDADPDLAERTRRRLFDRVSADGIAIAGYHFGFPNVGRLAVAGDGFVLQTLGV